MTVHLITFLGRAPEGVYRKATYRFEDGQEETTTFFGLALLRRLQSVGTPPRNLVILGTAHSMWDALVEFSGGPSPSDVAADLWTRLAGAVASSGVEAALLREAESVVTEGLHRIHGSKAPRVALRLIPYGRTTSEQVEILRVMASDVHSKDGVWLDVTHGFRHMTMLGLLSALHLQRSRNAVLRGIYYGALEMTPKGGGATPVLRLDGMLTVADWVVALAGYESGGDYGPVADLLSLDGFARPMADHLREGAFLEQTFQVDTAATKLRGARNALGGLPAGTPSSLFVDELRHRLDWVARPALSQQQWAVAQHALERRQYLRACAAALEALISERLEQGSPTADPSSYDLRERARQELKREHQDRRSFASSASLDDPRPAAPSVAARDWNLGRFAYLNFVRNAFVHGTGSPELRALLGTEATLRKRLQTILATL